MPIQQHPPQASLVTVNFDEGFRPPEMVKKRLAVVMSKPIQRRVGLCTVIPLSTMPPNHVMPYHEEIDIGFDLPQPWERQCWVKRDMVMAVGFHRFDLLRFKKARRGTKRYLVRPLDDATFRAVRRCMLHGLDLSVLTKNLTASM